MKICTTCNTMKSQESFYRTRKICKSCNTLRVRNYFKTKEGLVTKIYHHQVQSSKKRNHKLPTYTIKELKEWLFEKELFHTLFHTWSKSNFDTKIRPSIDRKDDYLGYSLNNIQLMTWDANNKKGSSDAISGINVKLCKKVEQYDINNNLLATYHSIKDASRKTNTSYSLISGVCNGKHKTANGYIWKFF